jgi:hypothetical protein
LLTTKLSVQTLKEIEDLNKKGFVKASNSLRRFIRKNMIEYTNIKIFRSGISSGGSIGSIKFTSHDIFGDHESYYYDIKKDKEFVDHLVNKFLMKNPDPDKGLKSAFSRLLHTNHLHWFGCSCKK